MTTTPVAAVALAAAAPLGIARLATLHRQTAVLQVPTTACTCRLAPPGQVIPRLVIVRELAKTSANV